MRAPSNVLKAIVHKFGRYYINKINESEALAQTFKRHNERPIEFRFVFDCLTILRPITVLDVGTGTTALPSLLASCGCVITAIDNVRDYWPVGMVNRHWQVIDDDISKPQTRERFDMITCVSVIEHIENHANSFRAMLNLLKPGGHLVLTTPYNERQSVPNVYALPNAAYGPGLPYICRSTSRRELDGWLRDTGAEIVRQEFWDFWSGDVWVQGTALPVPRQVSAADPHQLTCLLIRKPT
jgi:SAM-dependent methyltransferase